MNGSNGKPPAPGGKKLVEVLIVIFLLVLGTAMLMPSLQSIKYAAKQSFEGYRGEGAGAYDPMPLKAPSEGDLGSRTVVAQAQIKSFKAEINLTPRLSVGTAQPESIYEARFSAKIDARNPAAAKGKCEIQLPLPPQLISLSDLNVSLNGERGRLRPRRVSGVERRA